MHRPALPSHHIPLEGLYYLPTYVLPAQQHSLLEQIDAQPWSSELRRRVQHYGYRYDYTAHRVTPSMQALPFPDWLHVLAQRLCDDGQSPALPDQVIINEYVPGQGIAPHIDCVPCFGDTILSLSLGSACIMQFTHASSQEQVAFLLEPGSLLRLSGAARYEWKHGIPARKTDTVDGTRLPRQRRVSLTFRTVILTPDS